LIYVCAGMYRSGSTWLYNAVRLILQCAGTPDLAAGLISDRKKLLAHANTVIKVHGFDTGLISPGSIVLTSHRDLRDVAASLVRKFGSEAPLASLRETVDHHAKWTRVAAFDLRYEDLLKDEKGQVERVAGALRLPAAALAGLDYAALAHEIGREKFDAKRSTAERYDAVNLLHDGHVTDGRHGSWSGTLSAAEIRAIEREFWPWLTKRGYLS